MESIEDIVASLRALLSHTFKTEDTTEKNVCDELDALKKEKESAEESAEVVLREEKALEEEYKALKSKVESEHAETRVAEREVFTLMNEEREIAQKIDAIDRELSVLERDRQDFKNELQEAVSLLGRGAAMYFEYVVKDAEGKELQKEDIAAEARDVQLTRRRELERMKMRLEELGVGSNQDIEKEYKEVRERDEFLVHEIVDLTASVEKLEKLIEELTNDLNEQFISGLEKIGTEFARFFTLMFGGGNAELLRVKPKPKKKEEDAYII